MSKRKQQWSLPLAAGRSVVVDVAGDLKLAGWDEAVVLVQAAEGTRVELGETETGLSLRADAGCTVQLPRDAQLTLTAQGDVRLSELHGLLVVAEVAGDLAMRQVGSVDVGSVAGDLMVTGVLGDLTVGSVDGDASVKGVSGDLRLGSVAADLAVRDVTGNLSAHCDADAALALDPRPGKAYEVTAAADIVCRMPATASVDLTVASEGGSVQLRVPGAKEAEGEAGQQHVILGDGSATVVLRAGADVLVAADGSEGAAEPGGIDLGALEADMQRIARDMEASMAGLAEQLATSLQAAGFSSDQAERVAQRVSQANERAMRHAQHGVQRAKHHAERAHRRAERHAERHAERGPGRGWTWRWGGPFAGAAPNAAAGRSAPGRPARPGANEEERAAVLRMLSEKKISTEEAARLLEALEGR